MFEDIGCHGLSRGAGLITTPAFLDVAAGILAVEAYDAGLIRTVPNGLNARRIPEPGINATATEIFNARAALDGTGNDDIRLGMGVV